MRTCGECKYRNTEKSASPTWSVCDCPVPPWAHSDIIGQSWVLAEDDKASLCPCFLPKDTE
jgi:hypothetical protein